MAGGGGQRGSWQGICGGSQQAVQQLAIPHPDHAQVCTGPLKGDPSRCGKGGAPFRLPPKDLWVPHGCAKGKGAMELQGLSTRGGKSGLSSLPLYCQLLRHPQPQRSPGLTLLLSPPPPKDLMLLLRFTHEHSLVATSGVNSNLLYTNK